MSSLEILALCAMGLFALGFFGFVGYTFWAMFGSSPRRPKKLPDTIAVNGELLIDPDQLATETPDLVLTNDRSQYDLAEIARSIGFQVGSPTEPRLMSAVELLVHQEFLRMSDGGSGGGSTHSATAATLYDLVSCPLGEGTVSICNLEWIETISPSRGPTRTYHRGQTLVLYETPPHNPLPTFGLQKRYHQHARAMPLLRLLNPGIFREAQVRGDPEFTANVYVATKTPKPVLPLLTPSLRKLMLCNPDLMVNASGRFLAVYCRHSMIPCLAWERSAFLRTSQEIIATIAKRL